MDNDQPHPKAAAAVAAAATPPDSSSSSSSLLSRPLNPDIKRKNGQKKMRLESKPRYSLRVSRSKTPIGSVSPIQNAEKTEKIIIYTLNDYLAVRNESNGFFLCRTKQNVYKNSHKIKILWYTNDENSNIFKPDFLDQIDFECILTNVSVERLKEKNEVELPESEKTRVLNILERALKAEKGIIETLDPRKLLSDGLDISIIGMVDEKVALSKLDSGSKTPKKQQPKTPTDKNPTPNKRAKSLRSLKKEIEKIPNTDTTEMNKDSGNEKASELMVQKRQKETNEDSGKQEAKVKRIKTNQDNGRREFSEVQPSQVQPVENCTFIPEDPEPVFEPLPELVNKSFDDERDVMFETKTQQPYISLQVDSKLLIQAVILADHDLLEAKIRDSKFLMMDIYRSVAIKKNAIHYAIEKRDWKCLELLCQYHGSGQSSFSEPPVAVLQHCELLMDVKPTPEVAPLFPLDDSYAKFALKQGISYSSMLKLAPFLANGMEAFYGNFHILLKRGDFYTAQALSQASKDQIDKKNERKVHQDYKLIMDPKYSPEFDHEYCHRLKNQMLPLHVAAIHPDPHLFLTLMALESGQIHEPDIEGWTSIHFASVSSTFFNLQHLLRIGVSPRTVDQHGNTALHLATKMNRISNVELIIQHEVAHCRNPLLFNLYNRKGFTAFHIACHKGHQDVVSLFFQYNVAKVDFVTANLAGELTPLMIAARKGRLNIVKQLVAQRAPINATDPKNRTALTHAVMNGHSKIIDYFLKLGADPACKDSFGNNLLHYAMSYGWYLCYEILLKTTINIKDMNFFGMTAVYAAYVKGHIGFVDLILQKKLLTAQSTITDSGMDLVMLLFQTRLTSESLRLLKMAAKQHDSSKYFSRTDSDGNNALHHFLRSVKDTNYSEEQLLNINDALNILLKYGCSPFRPNMAGISPLDFSLLHQCLFPFFRFFKQFYKTPEFQQIVRESEHFWPLLVSNYYRIMPGNKDITFGEYIINISGQDTVMADILRNSALKTMANGDLPIEFFIKSCRFVQRLECSNYFPNQEDEDEQNCGKQINFLDFLVQFYDSEFLEDISIIHMVARYGFGWTLERFVDLLTGINAPDESGLTPLATALLQNNTGTARKLLEMKVSANFKIRKLSAFLYHLKHSRFLMPDLFLAAGVDVHQTDDLGNTGLHLMWEAPTLEKLKDNIVESTKFLLKNGVNVNARNIHGQTAFHVACQSAFSSHELELFFQQLIKTDSFRPDVLDHNGYNAFNYMFLKCQQSLNILKTILDKGFSFESLKDRRHRNLLHYTAQSGLTESVLFLVQHIDPNVADQDRHTPLSLAIANGHKECALALLKCPIVLQYFRHEIIDSNGWIKLNLLTEMYRQDWQEALYVLEAMAIEKNRLAHFVQQLLESQCLNHAKRILRTHHFSRDQLKTFLLAYAKYVKENHWTFLDIFDPELMKSMATELLFCALCWWNYPLYEYFMYQLLENDPKICENPDLLPKCFQNMVYEDGDIPTFIRSTIQAMVECPPNSTLNLLSRYPIVEQTETVCRYRFLPRNHDPAQWSNIQYSPLIVAVIRKRYNDVAWFLTINRLDVNFPDSQGRTALIHAITNHDLEMISILLGRNLCFGRTPRCPTTAMLSTNRKVNLMARDSKGLTAFHYLIRPFQAGTFQDAEKVFASLWELLDYASKTADFQNELYQYAKENGTEHVVGRKNCAELETVEEAQFEKNRFRTEFENFLANAQTNNHGAEEKANLSPTKAIPDKASGIPLNVTLTKLNFQNDGHILYNFFKMEVLSVGEHYCLSNRWGQVGTVGYQRRMFYQREEEAVEKFKKIFADKCGENWTQARHLVSPQDDTSESSITGHCNLATLMGKLENCKFNGDQWCFKDLVLQSLVQLRLLAYDQVYEGLSTKSLEQCSFILNRLSKLIAWSDSLKIKNKNNVKVINDMIDLSERFYPCIKIFGTKYDQLKPILNGEDLEDKSRLVKKLKAIVFTVEFLYFITTVDRSTTNHWNSLHSYLKWNIRPLANVVDCDLIKIYLDVDDEQQTKLNVFQLDETDVVPYRKGKDRYLLWYHLERHELLNFFVNGFESQPVVIQLSSHLFQSIIVNGVSFDNHISCTEPGFAVLCEVSIENSMDVFTDRYHPQQFDTDGYSYLENKDCLAINPARTSDEKARYLFWNGCIVPRPTDRQTRYIHLNIQKMVPRYLVEIKSSN